MTVKCISLLFVLSVLLAKPMSAMAGDEMDVLYCKGKLGNHELPVVVNFETQTVTAIGNTESMMIGNNNTPYFGNNFETIVVTENFISRGGHYNYFIFGIENKSKKYFIRTVNAATYEKDPKIYLTCKSF